MMRGRFFVGGMLAVSLFIVGCGGGGGTAGVGEPVPDSTVSRTFQEILIEKLSDPQKIRQLVNVFYDLQNRPVSNEDIFALVVWGYYGVMPNGWYRQGMFGYSNLDGTGTIDNDDFASLAVSPDAKGNKLHLISLDPQGIAKYMYSEDVFKDEVNRAFRWNNIKVWNGSSWEVKRGTFGPASLDSGAVRFPDGTYGYAVRDLSDGWNKLTFIDPEGRWAMIRYVRPYDYYDRKLFFLYEGYKADENTVCFKAYKREEAGYMDFPYAGEWCF